MQSADEVWDVVIAGAGPAGLSAALVLGRCRRRVLLLATGLSDDLPPVPGAAAPFGSSLHRCPDCDGWEFRDAPLAACGRRRRGLEMARALTAWSRDIVLCSDGPARLSSSERQDLAGNGIRLVETRVLRFEGADGRLQAVVFADGSRLPRQAQFFDLPARPQSGLARRLGCEKTRRGKAAFGINRSLTREDFVRRATGERRIEHPPVVEPGDEPAYAPADAPPDPRADAHASPPAAV